MSTGNGASGCEFAEQPIAATSHHHHHHMAEMTLPNPPRRSSRRFGDFLSRGRRTIAQLQARSWARNHAPQLVGERQRPPLDGCGILSRVIEASRADNDAGDAGRRTPRSAPPHRPSRDRARAARRSAPSRLRRSLRPAARRGRQQALARGRLPMTPIPRRAARATAPSSAR